MPVIQKEQQTHYIRIMIATILASGVMGLLGRMTSIAYPVFQEFFQANMIHMQWVMTAPILAAASLILIGGRLGDFFGKKRLFQIGLIVFSIGALLSAISAHVLYLIIGQGLIGFGMSLSAPACLSLIKQEVHNEKQGEAIGLWAGLSGAFGALGLLAGGYIIEQFGWPATFYIAIPFSVLAIIIIPSEENQSKTASTERIHVGTVIGIFLSIFSIVLALINGNQSLWESPWNYAALMISVLIFVSLIIWQNKSQNPLIPLHVFKNKTVLGANLGTFFIYFSLNGIYIFLVFHLQSFYEYPPSEAGWAMLPTSLMVTLFASTFGKLKLTFFGNSSIRVGSFLMCIGFIGLIFIGEQASYFTHFFPFILVLGIGLALLVSPITTAALDVSSKESGLASGINNLVARFSGLLAVGIIGGVFGMVEGGVEKFQISAIIMAGSVVIGTLCIWGLIPQTSNK